MTIFIAKAKDPTTILNVLFRSTFNMVVRNNDNERNLMARQCYSLDFFTINKQVGVMIRYSYLLILWK